MWDKLLRWSGSAARRRSPSDHRRSVLSPGDAWKATLFVVVALCIVARLVLSFVDLPRSLQLQQRCRMSRMWPSYVRHDPPSSVGLSAKYRLYLYREAPPGVTGAPPTGRPALFVPGNAGSYGQVRSVASSARHLFERGEGGEGSTEVDWWSVDFNEDFSAFHGATMHEQALYLNDVLVYLQQHVYTDAAAKTRTIPILAHSMGGIVARLMLLENNHPNGSVETIITLSSPHAYPPVPIEAGLEDVYTRIYDASHSNAASSVLLVSLSGGVLDDQLSSEGSVLGLAQVWRADTSLHAFTSSLAAVWSGVDHLAMMWCDQVRERIARAVLRIEGKNAPLVQRREQWRRMLGIERASDVTHSVLEMGSALPSADESSAAEGSEVDRTEYPVMLSDAASTAAFELLTDFNVGLDASFGPPVEQKAGVRVDLCNAEQECRSVLPSAYDILPPSPAQSTGQRNGFPVFPEAERRYGLPGQAMRRLNIQRSELQKEGTQKIRVERQRAANGFLSAGWSEGPIERWFYRFLTPLTRFTFDFRFPHTSKPSDEVVVRTMDSTLLAYTLRAHASKSVATQCSMAKGTAPLLRVRSLSTGDTQYFPSLQTDSTYKLMLHGASPYMPPPEASATGTSFTLLLDTCNRVGSITIAVDWRASAGLLLSRYRTAAVALPFASLMLVVSMVWEQWDCGMPFPNTLASLYANLPLAFSLLLVTSLAASAVQRVANDFLHFEGHTWIDNLTLGIPRSPFFYTAGVTLMLVVMAYGLAMLVAAVLDALVHILSLPASRWAVSTTRQKDKRQSASASPVWPLVGLALLGVATFTFLPVQFVFLVLFLVQLSAAARSTACARLSVDGKLAQHDVANQHRMLLNVFFWLLPLNAPVLLVWTRNLLNGWYGTLGHADHNVLQVIGFVLVGYISCSDEAIPRATMRFNAPITTLLVLRCALYAVLYGVRYTYGLFGTTETLCVWLAWLYLGPKLFATRRGMATTTGDAYDVMEVEQLVQTSDQPRHSILPVDIAEDEAPLPETIQSSLQGTTGYAIKDSEKSSDVQPTQARSTSAIDLLLEEYLATLDEYVALRERLSEVVAQGAFQLSRARMQLGTPYLTRGWDARMKATLSVKVEPDTGAVSLKPIVPVQQQEETNTDKDESKTTLRRRKGGNDEKSEAGDPVREKDAEKSEKKAPASFDPLYQFSALPPPALRHAQSRVRELIDVAVGGGKHESAGLVGVLQRLESLERQIREERSRRKASAVKP